MEAQIKPTAKKPAKSDAEPTLIDSVTKNGVIHETWDHPDGYEFTKSRPDPEYNRPAVDNGEPDPQILKEALEEGFQVTLDDGSIELKPPTPNTSRIRLPADITCGDFWDVVAMRNRWYREKRDAQIKVDRWNEYFRNKVWPVGRAPVVLDGLNRPPSGERIYYDCIRPPLTREQARSQWRRFEVSENLYRSGDGLRVMHYIQSAEAQGGFVCVWPDGAVAKLSREPTPGEHGFYEDAYAQARLELEQLFCRACGADVNLANYPW